jgi:hypothetical protein
VFEPCCSAPVYVEGGYIDPDNYCETCGEELDTEHWCPPPLGASAMSISPDRIINACDWKPWSERAELVEQILLADDLFRAAHQPAAPGTDEEPKLPEGVTVEDDDNHFHEFYLYRKNGDKMMRKEWTPADLRAVANHIEWKDRQRTREQEAAKVPDKPIKPLTEDELATIRGMICEWKHVEAQRKADK